MTQKFYKWPSTGQYRDFIKQFNYDRNSESSTIDKDVRYIGFTGTVKVHGTNAAIVFPKSGDIYYQSRANIITPMKDNFGFAGAMSVIDNLKDLIKGVEFEESVVVFGEWFGKGIQDNVAVSKVERCFGIFAVMVDGVRERYFKIIDTSKFTNIIDLRDPVKFPIFACVVDIENPEEVQNYLVKLTLEVEELCPVGHYFGEEGVGEGIVWVNDLPVDGKHYMFKTRGKKHSSSKVETIASVDIDKLNSLKSLAEYCCTENRMNQMFDLLRSHNILGMSEIPKFIHMLNDDICKEELDTIIGNGFEFKDIVKHVGNIARPWYINKIKSL